MQPMISPNPRTSRMDPGIWSGDWWAALADEEHGFNEDYDAKGPLQDRKS